jgi:hypothetical protein
MSGKTAMPVSLHNNEWDFRPCTDAEMLACWTYELLREKYGGRDTTRLKLFWRATGNPWSQMVGKMEQFPETSWLSIPSKHRKSAQRDMTSDVSTFKNHLWEDCAEYIASCPDDPNVSTVIMDLDWRKSDTKLKKDFEAILSNLRPAKSQSRNTGRQGTVRDKLNALGARRLLRHFGNDAERAIQYMDSQNVKTLYGDARALRRAAKKAEDLISGSGSTETQL